MLLRKIYYAFPVRLLALHLRSHTVLVGVWVVLGLFTTGLAGRFFGMHYLLLTPEYLGEVNFWSFLIAGAAFGAMVMIWNLTTYLLTASRFPFLATLQAPFTKFSLNNSLIPLGYLSAWLTATTWFQTHDELTKTWEIIANIGGFLCGAAGLILGLALYLYFTNKDIGAFLRPRKFIPKPGGRLLIPGQRLPTLGEIQSGSTRWRVDTYLTERFHWRLVRSVAHYDIRMLGQVFRQNHWNAVVVQVVALLFLMLLGLFMESAWVRIPSAATLFLLASMGMALFGAITFWFRQWSFFVFLSLLLAVDLFTGFGFFNYRSRAYGLDYRWENRQAYDYPLLEQWSDKRHIADDRAATIAVLENWLARNKTPQNPKPKLVFLCVSGGGLRAALWTMQTMQQTDKALEGKLMRQAFLITGASGGMLGAAYVRELYLRRQSDESIDLYNPVYIEDMGMDLLNPVGFAVVANDLLYPMRSFESGRFRYKKDRGYLFERQLNENCRGYFSRRLADYREPERRASIPMMVLSPYILNDNRRLLISPLGVSYLMRPAGPGRFALQTEVDGVDFGKLFENQDADSLSFTNALRMNCTFPFILPNVWLPTKPSLEIMDAGVRDNYGITLAARFAQTFKGWIEEHTGGVVFVQIRCWDKVERIAQIDNKGIVGSLFTPATAAANLTSLQDFEQDDQLSLLADLMGKNRMHVIRFLYRPVRKKREASLSLHLSKREKMDLLEAFYLPENQANVAALRQLLQ